MLKIKIKPCVSYMNVFWKDLGLTEHQNTNFGCRLNWELFSTLSYMKLKYLVGSFTSPSFITTSVPSYFYATCLLSTWAIMALHDFLSFICLCNVAFFFFFYCFMIWQPFAHICKIGFSFVFSVCPVSVKFAKPSFLIMYLKNLN